MAGATIGTTAAPAGRTIQWACPETGDRGFKYHKAATKSFELVLLLLLLPFVCGGRGIDETNLFFSALRRLQFRYRPLGDRDAGLSL